MTAPEMTWLGADRGSGWKYGYWDTWGQSDMKDRVQYTRTDLCIRRDDPALRQVMEALDAISGAVPRFDYCECGPGGVDLSKPGSPYDRGKDDAFKLLQPTAKAALAAMQELIGGN